MYARQCHHGILTFPPLETGYGFNPGSALLLQNAKSAGAIGALAAANTSLSAAGGAISSLFANLYYQERKTGELSFDLTSAMNGALAGLVAVTAGCAVVEYWAALLIGLGAGLVYLVGSRALVRYRIDDACDAIPVHLFCGLWGTLVVGLLASPSRIADAYGADSPVAQHAGLFMGGGATLLACQVVEVLFIAGWSAATMTPFFFWLQYYGWLRVDSLEERVGLDRSYHGEQKKADAEDDFFLSRLDLQAYRKERQRRREQKREQKLAGGQAEDLAADLDSVLSWNGLSYDQPAAAVSRQSESDADDDATSGRE
jgi:ammonia channel protein AmtB